MCDGPDDGAPGWRFPDGLTKIGINALASSQAKECPNIQFQEPGPILFVDVRKDGAWNNG